MSLTSVPGKMMGQILLEGMLQHMGRREITGVCQQGFAKGKLCLATQVVFCSGVTAPANKGKAPDDINLDFCKAFGTTLSTLNCTDTGSTDGLLDG